MKNKQLILLIIGVIALCAVTVYTTYAFFLASASQTEGGTSVQSGDFDIVYNKGTDIIGGSLTPSVDKSGGLNTSISIKKNENSIDAKYKILVTFLILDEGLKSEAFKWELYRGTEITPVSSGNFADAITDTSIVILTDEILSTTEAPYTLYLWLDGDLATNETQNQKFSATLKVETYQMNK